MKTSLELFFPTPSLPSFALGILAGLLFWALPSMSGTAVAGFGNCYVVFQGGCTLQKKPSWLGADMLYQRNNSKDVAFLVQSKVVSGQGKNYATCVERLKELTKLCGKGGLLKVTKELEGAQRVKGAETLVNMTVQEINNKATLVKESSKKQAKTLKTCYGSCGYDGTNNVKLRKTTLCKQKCIQLFKQTDSKGVAALKTYVACQKKAESLSISVRYTHLNVCQNTYLNSTSGAGTTGN